MQNGEFNQWYQKGNFELQKATIAPKKRFLDLSYYTIVYVLADKKDEILVVNESENSLTAFAFTENPTTKQNGLNYLEFTLGELSQQLSSNRLITFIKINPQTTNSNELNKCEEIIFCPLKDKMSRQLTITSLHHTLPLLAIDDKKVSTMNFEGVYGFFRDTDLPQDTNDRTTHILKMIDFLQFVTARTPIKFGSSSVMCIFLEL